MRQTTPLPNVDISSPRFKADPYPFFARLRAEAPVHRVWLPAGLHAYLVTRYDDVVTVLKDERFGKDKTRALAPDQLKKQPWMPKVFQPLTRNMLDLDPPDHTRLRALVQKTFTPGLVEGLRGRIQELADGLLDAAIARGRMDLVRDYALPIPTTIIAEMLGIPASDRHKFQRWSRALLSASFSVWSVLVTLPSVLAFLGYIRKQVRASRAAPGTGLLHALAAAEEAGDVLSEDELLAMVVLLLIAGHETTVHLIDNSVLALLAHPEQAARLRDDPALIRPAIEEFLRYDGPLMTSTERYAREDVTIAGTTIPHGSMVFPVLSSANRDERQFPRPDELDLAREPNHHLAFGLGPHYCLGAPLARLEGQVAIGTLLRRLPNLRLTIPKEKLRWRRGIALRGLEALPVEFSAPRIMVAPHVVANVRSPRSAGEGGTSSV
jgi:cytochrome P450 PksS